MKGLNPPKVSASSRLKRLARAVSSKPRQSMARRIRISDDLSGTNDIEPVRLRIAVPSSMRKGGLTCHAQREGSYDQSLRVSPRRHGVVLRA